MSTSNSDWTRGEIEHSHWLNGYTGSGATWLKYYTASHYTVHSTSGKDAQNQTIGKHLSVRKYLSYTFLVLAGKNYT